MKALVVGAGEVGLEIASRLSRDNQDVVVVERNTTLVEKARNCLDALVIQGSGASVSVLERAGLKEADLMIAVTGYDEVNIVACLLAKRFGVPRTVARLRNPEYGGKKALVSNEALGIDLVINPERVTAIEIADVLKNPSAVEVEYFAGGRLQMLGFRVDPEAPIVGKRIVDLDLTVLIAAISRNGDIIIPHGDVEIRARDLVYVLGRTGSLTGMGLLVRRKEDSVRQVMIVGGGRIGCQLAQMLQSYRHVGLSVKLIEQDPDRCMELAEILPDVLLLHGSGTDLELLQEENVAEMDAFVAASGHDEASILSALLAKHLGVPKVIAAVNEAAYGPLINALGIDQGIHPRLVTASTILRLLRGGQILSVTILKDERVEVTEMSIPDRAPALRRQLKHLKLPRGILVGGIARGDEIIIPRGNDMLLPGDEAVIVSLPDKAETVSRYFSPPQ